VTWASGGGEKWEIGARGLSEDTSDEGCGHWGTRVGMARMRWLGLNRSGKLGACVIGVATRAFGPVGGK